jgi:hypothetical protein
MDDCIVTYFYRQLNNYIFIFIFDWYYVTHIPNRFFKYSFQMITSDILKKTPNLKNLRFPILCIGFFTGLFFTVAAQTWVHDTFEDFIKGTLDASGANFYVSRDGKIRTIHRFDYNDDGYIDLLFPKWAGSNRQSSCNAGSGVA